MKNWILSTSRKRIDFIWTYSGWFNYISWSFMAIVVVFLAAPADFRLPLLGVLLLLAVALVIDVLIVFVVDRRNRCQRLGRDRSS